MFNSATASLEATKKALADAQGRIGNDRFQWIAWPQKWPSTSCGFGGIGGQSFMDAQTVIASCDDDRILVYHNGRFAYEVCQPNEAFYVACGQRNLPGAKDWAKVSCKYDSAAR
jgi:hypothetical protein